VAPASTTELPAMLPCFHIREENKLSEIKSNGQTDQTSKLFALRYLQFKILPDPQVKMKKNQS
jgi:hypothetical protein